MDSNSEYALPDDDDVEDMYACPCCLAPMPDEGPYCSGCRRVIMGTGSYYPFDDRIV